MTDTTPEPHHDQAAFLRAFSDELVRLAGSTVFNDGSSVVEYAAQTGPSYWQDKSWRMRGPIVCAGFEFGGWYD